MRNGRFLRIYQLKVRTNQLSKRIGLVKLITVRRMSKREGVETQGRKVMKTIMREKQWTEKYPELDTGPVPNESCVSPEYFELELDRFKCG